MPTKKNNFFNHRFLSAAEKEKCHNTFKKVFTAAMREDLSSYGDITTKAIFQKQLHNKKVVANIVAREECIVCGINLAKKYLPSIIPNLQIITHFTDGQLCQANQVIASITCRVSSLLSTERTLLNILQRLSAIATKTYFTKKLLPKDVCLLDTRKTTPTLRILEKYAVVCGGGQNHRFGLYDAYMLKDNHIFFAAENNISLTQAIMRLLKHRNKTKKQIIIEVDTVAQLTEILTLPILRSDIILLDNMNETTTKQCLKLIAGKFTTELSGKINKKRLASVNKLYRQGYKINRVSMGAITHSAKVVDLSMEAVRP